MYDGEGVYMIDAYRLRLVYAVRSNTSSITSLLITHV